MTDESEKIKAMLRSLSDRCGPHGGAAPTVLSWSAKDIGWGEFVFYYSGDKLHCANEKMSKEFIKKMLCQMVDDAELDE